MVLCTARVRTSIVFSCIEEYKVYKSLIITPTDRVFTRMGRVAMNKWLTNVHAGLTFNITERQNETDENYTNLSFREKGHFGD